MATTDLIAGPVLRAAVARPNGRLIRRSLRMAFLVFLCLAIVLPLAKIAHVSLLDRSAVFGDGTGRLGFGSYARVMREVPFGRYFLNSLIVTGAATIGSTLTAILAAYAFARTSFPGRDALFLAVVGTLMIPSHITLIPNYLTFARFHALDTYWALTLPTLASGFSIFFLRQYMMGIPASLEEAARMDGAGRLMILRTIIVPLCWPAIAVVSLFAFMAEWNNFIWPLLATTSDDMRTVQIGLRYLMRNQGEGAAPDWPLVMAGTILSLAPLLIAYVVAERHLVRGITMGGHR